MGIFGSIAKALGFGKPITDVDQFMSTGEAENLDVLHKKADSYVMPITIQNDQDAKIVEEELKKGNVIILNFNPLLRNPHKLKPIITELRKIIHSLDGDIARINEDKLLLTPARVKIVKKRSR